MHMEGWNPASTHSTTSARTGLTMVTFEKPGTAKLASPPKQWVPAFIYAAPFSMLPLFPIRSTVSDTLFSSPPKRAKETKVGDLRPVSQTLNADPKRKHRLERKDPNTASAEKGHHHTTHQTEKQKAAEKRAPRNTKTTRDAFILCLRCPLPAAHPDRNKKRKGTQNCLPCLNTLLKTG